MFFNSKKVAVALVCLISAASASSLDDLWNYCANSNQGPWGDIHTIGGQDGDIYCAQKAQQGLIVTGIEVWGWGQWGITGLELTFSDDSTSGLIGIQDHDVYDKKTWSSTDSIKTLKLWGNGKGSSLGHIYLETHGGVVLDVGKDTNGISTYEIDIQSGVILGAMGFTNPKGITSAGFMFMKSKVKSMQLANVQLPMSLDDLQKAGQGIKQYVVDKQSFDNTGRNTPVSQTWAFNVHVSTHHEVTTDKTSAWSNGGSVSVGLGGGIPELQISTDTTIDWSESGSTETTTNDSKDEDFDLSISKDVTIPPYTVTNCQAVTEQGSYSTTFTADIQLTLEDGTIFSFGSQGKIDQVLYSHSNGTCKDNQTLPAMEKLPGVKRGVVFLG